MYKLGFNFAVQECLLYNYNYSDPNTDDVLIMQSSRVPKCSK